MPRPKTMQIIEVGKENIRRFIDFPDKLYRGDKMYVPYMKRDLAKTLERLLLTEKTYTALLALDDSGKKVLARVLFTVAPNKQLNTANCGFFSHYECVNDPEVSRALIGRMTEMLKAKGAEYVSGPYFPDDPDNRRGFVIKGFTPAPLIFTSYNPEYYNQQFTDAGFEKDADTYQYSMTNATQFYDRVRRLGSFACTRYDVRVDTVDWDNLERDIHDFHTVMEAATNDIIYQSAPTEDEIRAILSGWRNFLNKDFILIARKNTTDKPIGIVMAIPDFYQLFRKMRGRTDLRGLLILLFERKRIRSIRAMLQYVIPEYQSRGVVVSLYAKLLEMVQKHNVDHIEAGTILENNVQSISSMTAIGGELARIYRIYTLKLEKRDT